MRFIDLRSDTVTEPTQEMLEAMSAAEVGDDVYEDDPTVIMLQEKASEILGKQDSLFVPTGTFGNQLSILTHTSRGEEVLIPEDNHIVLYEVGAYAVISSACLRFVKSDNGKIDITDITARFRSDDIHYPVTGLVCTENAHSAGKVVPLSNMEAVYNVSKRKGVPVHLDGARIFNAAACLGIEAKEITKFCDSVMICLSKGLCSPIGSIIAGDHGFISRARKNRKMMGGGMRQVGYLAASGIISIEKMAKRLKIDHDNAVYLAGRLEESGFFKVEKNRLDINMVFCRLKPDVKGHEKMVRHLLEKKIKINPQRSGKFRFVTHYWIGKKEIDYFVDELTAFIQKS